VTFSGCTDKKNTGASGTVPELAFGQTGTNSTITWAAGHGTTTISMTWTASSKDEREKAACPSGTSESVGRGTVVGDTGLASSIAVGGKVTIEVCLGTNVVLNMEPDKLFRF
jgi:hypothetical protein